jgi:hypothetical protein
MPLRTSSKPRRAVRFVGFACAAALLALGCDVQISEQEALFRYRPATDTVDLLVIHEGVSASDRKDKTLAGAKQIARRFLEKRRYLHLLGNPISWDLDDIQERLASGALAKDTTPQELELLEMILPRCVLERGGGFVDPKGRLSAYQLYRIEGFSKVVQLWNQLLSRAILEAMREPEKFAANTPLLDARTRDLWRVHAEKSRDWIRVAGDGLDFVIPITRAALDNAQAALSAELRGEDAPATSAYLGQLMPYLAGWSHSDDTLRLSLRPAGGVFHTRYWSNATYDPLLREALAAEGVVPDTHLDLAAVRALFPAEKAAAAGSSPPEKK